MKWKKRITKSITLALVGITFLTPTFNSISAMEKSQIPISRNVEEMSIKQMSIYADDKLAMVEDKNERGVATITAKVLRKTLIKYKSKIVTLLKKLPYGDTLSDMFVKYFDRLCSFLDKVSGGAQQAIYKFFRNMGFSHFWADLIADGIMTVIGWLL